MMSRTLLSVLTFLLISVTTVKATPRLGVVIVVDQLCADQLTRYASLFTGGFRTLAGSGVVFDEAHHDHAMTLTAPGHAALATGCYPNRHGIVGNNWYERATGRRVYACDDSTVQILGDVEAMGRSPHYLMTDALGDWVKKANSGAKVFSISQKDRSAILLGGQRPDGAYWFDDAKGRFVTSTYYLDTIPGWVRDFDYFSFRERAIREGWRKMWPDETYALADADDFPSENDGIRTTFPHLYDSVAAVARTPSEWMIETPFGDEMLLGFARAMITSEGLGRDSIADLLCIGMSAFDLIGHTYGPHSQESLDALLRIDRNLGAFISTLDSLVGIGQYTIVLSSDHGVMPFPEETSRSGEFAERILRAENKQQLEAAARQVADAAGIARPLIVGQLNGLMLDTRAGEEKGIRPPDLREAVAEALRKIDYVEEVMTYEDLALPDAGGRGFREMYRRSFHPDRAPDIAIRYKENVLVLDSQFGTTHGSPYRYDTHVPLIFLGAGVAHDVKPIKDRVRTIDAAPTMAVLMGLEPPKNIDGVVLDVVIAGNAHSMH